MGWLLFAGTSAAQTATLPFSVTPGTFPTTKVGATSPITLTFTWTGSATGSLSNFSIPSNPTAPSPFLIQANGCTGATLNYTDICKVTLDFAPAVAGPATGSLDFSFTAGSEQGTDSIPLSGDGQASTPAPCHCVRLQAQLGSVRAREHGNLIVFDLHWKLECSGGSGTCRAVMEIDHTLRGGQVGSPDYLTFLHEPAPEGRLRVRCKGDCGKTTNGEVELALHQRQRDRKDEVLHIEETHHCDGEKKTSRFTIAFDAEGRFDPAKSHLK